MRALGVFLLLLGLQAVARAQSQMPTVLTKAAEVHDLPAATAQMGVPVHLIATVTYYDPGEHTLFVADASGAVFVQTTHAYPLHRGDLVQIDGVTGKSYRTVVAPDPKIAVLGRGVLPRVKMGSPRYQDLMAGRWDSQFVMLRGVVRSAVVEQHAGGLVLELQVLLRGGVVQAYVQDYRGIDPGRLIDAEVTISGVAAGEFNARWDLMRSVIYGAAAGDLKIVREPRTQPLQLPATAVGDIMQTHAVEDESQRVRVRGAVIYYRPGIAVVVEQADGQSVSARTRQEDGTALGAIVDLVGFASEGGYGPELAETEIFPTGQFAKIMPTPVSYAEAMVGTYNDNLVSVRGRVESELHADSSDTLFLRVDDHAVTIVLQTWKPSERLPDVPAGTLVAVSGICRITPTAVWGTPGATPMLFRLDMRTRDDLQVLQWPSWWTVRHLLFVLGALLVLALLITAWALVLRRKVERTMRLEQERSRLLEAINSETPLEQLLEGILASVATLAGGLRCCCRVLDSTSEGRDANRCICLGAALEAAEVRFEASLTDSKGRHIGEFQAGGGKGRELSKYEREVMEVGTGLANVAVNQRRMYQELNYTSTHDQLTALPNRRLSDMTLELALQQAAESGMRIGVAYIDVDRFKQVNDQHGHKVGDLYLQQIAERLMAVVRAEDKLARVGGDEFLLIATGLHGVEDAEGYRCRLEQCFENGFVLEGARVYGSASIGIAVFPDHGATAEELKRHADIDMYSVKHSRRSELEQRSSKPGETDIYSPADLEAALEIEQFRVFYQPQFSAKGELRGVEALLRLEDPILGMVTPDAFIGVAERHDLILPLGAWVLRKALADAAMWQMERMAGVRMVVNVAARQFEHPRFADDVAAELERAGLPPSSLELEITERTIARDVEEAMRQLHRLHAVGVSISIDDFGAGHSCLSALHKLPVDTLKIDRSFVHAMGSEPEVLHVIEAIVALARTMRKRVVAEGVETREDVEGLLQLGEMDLQGFYFGLPQPSEEFASSLRAWRGGVAILE
jgi:diguanylate cyclase (GGDEF)-like protein